MKRIKTVFLSALVSVMAGAQGLVENPIVTSHYTADPSARVFNDTLYVYPSHDRDDAKTFSMQDYHVYSTTDMVNFTHRGLCFDALKESKWATRYAWAPDCVERNGKYYLYYPTDQKHIGVAVSDTPTGPFRDAIGKPLISINSPGVVCNRDFIDPCVFVDDDGQAYLFVGQNDVCCVKLNDDMVSYDHTGGRRDARGVETGVHVIDGVFEFFEAVWVHKHNGKYYMSYSNGSKNGKAPEIAYAMADSPMGPYEYKGVILAPVSSGTNHHSIVEYRGQWYLFYHNSDLSRFRNPELRREYKYRRSMCVERLEYNEDGTIKPVRQRGCSREKMAEATRLTCELSAETGGIKSLRIKNGHSEDSMNWVLAPDGTQYPWITARHAWGLGRMKVNGAAAEWVKADRVEGNDACYSAGNIKVKVKRTYSDGGILEKYTFVNMGNTPAALTDIAVNTPVNDNYPSSSECVRQRANAHVWTGGNAAYICATRMSGASPGLGIMLTDGSVSGYEITERGQDKGSSNFRGVIALNPDGRVLLPGDSMSVAWRMFTHTGWEDFHSKMLGYGGVVAKADRYMLQQGDTARVTFATKYRTDTVLVKMDKPGERVCEYEYGDGKKTWVRLYCVSSFGGVASRRVDFALRHQQERDKGHDAFGAFLVYDNEIGRLYDRPSDGKPYRHFEGAERIGTGLMIAQYMLNNPEKKPDYLGSFLEYVNFVRTKLQTPNYTVYTNLSAKKRNRHYNYPWTADLYYRAYQLTGERKYLVDAYNTLEKLFGTFGYDFYGIGFPVLLGDSLLREAGMVAEADSLVRHFRKMGDRYIKNGVNYPPHEVAYEQSIVTPAIISLCELYLVTKDPKYLRCAELQMPLADSFEGRQPDHRLNRIAIRHWDGVWAGKRGFWGDTMPHFWSALDGFMFYRYAQCIEHESLAGNDSRRLPNKTADTLCRLRRTADNIIKGNFSLFAEDGSATCAYIYPDRVNGLKAKMSDPWANDQDWVIYYYLMFQDIAVR